MTQQNDDFNFGQASLPEAPASATCKFISPGGAEWMLTVRDFQVSQLLKKIATVEEYLLIKHGWSVAGQRSTNGSQAQAHNGVAPICPTHQTPMRASAHGGGWYCPQKVAEAGGGADGSKPIYCRARVGVK